MQKELYLYAYNRNTGDFCEKKVEPRPYFPESLKDKWEISIDVFKGTARFDCTRVFQSKDINNRIFELINFTNSGLAYLSANKQNILEVKSIFVSAISGKYTTKLEELKELENQIYDEFHKELRLMDNNIIIKEEQEIEVEL